MKILAPKPDKFTGPEHHRLHSRLAEIVTHVTTSGTTAQRPASDLYAGRFYFDTTLGQPIWYDAAAGVWVDATGTPA